jgi:hypothetical protein|tara:strand:- start:1154 stop:1492 length:339 start_codon:yes stop_codon:yes gene_type:complete
MDTQNIEPTDFIILVRPHLDKKNKWTGEVTLKMVVDKANKLDDDDFYSMISFTKQVCASVPLMEENKIFRDETERLADKYLSHDDMIEGIDRLTKTRERVNNIIHVDFKPEA